MSQATPDIEHLAEILYSKITYEEQYWEGENLALTSDGIFQALYEIVKQISDVQESEKG